MSDSTNRQTVYELTFCHLHISLEHIHYHSDGFNGQPSWTCTYFHLLTGLKHTHYHTDGLKISRDGHVYTFTYNTFSVSDRRHWHTFKLRRLPIIFSIGISMNVIRSTVITCFLSLWKIKKSFNRLLHQLQNRESSGQFTRRNPIHVMKAWK